MSTTTPALTPQAYRASAVAKLLGISVRGVYRLLDSGELASTRIGKARVVPAVVLTEYVERLNAAARAESA